MYTRGVRLDDQSPGYGSIATQVSEHWGSNYISNSIPEPNLVSVKLSINSLNYNKDIISFLVFSSSISEKYKNIFI